MDSCNLKVSIQTQEQWSQDSDEWDCSEQRIHQQKVFRGTFMPPLQDKKLKTQKRSRERRKTISESCEEL